MTGHAYIHIPFCLRKCAYCSFVSGVNIKNKDVYINALLKEISVKYWHFEGLPEKSRSRAAGFLRAFSAQNDNLWKHALKTLYIGGGTPSLFSCADIKKLLKCFIFEAGAEITLEANPETASPDKFKGYYDAGINRISLGIQTFNNDILKAIGRGHTALDAENAVKAIKEAGFKNISIDLIYGLPNQTIECFMNDLDRAVNLGVQHISLYGLKIEEGSYFYRHKPENLPDDDMQADMYLEACRFLNKFNHYEISNFALKGFESRHNTAYWLNKEYYGFGLNASGYEGNIRYKNTPDFGAYINNPLNTAEKSELSKEETLENEIFLALRLKQGVNIKEISRKYNINFEEKYGGIIEKYNGTGLLKLNNGILSLTKEGILLSNEIMSEFIGCDF